MRIFDRGGKRVLAQVTLFLTPAEAAELARVTANLAAEPDSHHNHVYDAEYSQEIVVAVYTPDNLRFFDSESRWVIDHGTVGDYEA